MDFTAIDVETANQSQHSICQIGLVKVQGGEIVKESVFVVQPPGNRYVSWNSLIHGMSALNTKKAPFFPEVWKKISGDIVGALLVAHNAPFDIGCLQQTMAYYGIEVPELQYRCTYQLTGESLSGMCQAFGIDIDRHHDALCDARACAKIYLKLLNGESPDFSRVVKKQRSKYSLFEGHQRITGDLLTPDLENGDPGSPFYAKKVVFTGALSSIDRLEAAAKVKALGADIDAGVTKKTNYVIVGSAPGPAKIRKIEKYQAAGCDIRLVFEKEFLKMIDAG